MTLKFLKLYWKEKIYIYTWWWHFKSLSRWKF